MHRYLFKITLIVLATAAGMFAQTPSPTPQLPDDLKGVPAIATNYRSDDRSFPELGRVGVDILQQRSLTLREAIELALENNRDIEVSRKTAGMAEYDLRATDGFFQTRLTGQTYYERSVQPNVSVFSTNRNLTNGTLVGNLALQAFVPRYGTVVSGTFNNQKLDTDNSIAVLSPQYNTGLGVLITQPLLRGRKTDQSRRTIEIAKRNVSLTDTQFRQRSIETVANVQKAYWDLAYTLRNLQVQRDSVRDARQQLEHNRRLVAEGQLAPIDIVAAETQVANFEQAVYDALNLVNVAENALKNLVSPNRITGIWNEALTPVDPVEVAVPDPTLPEAMKTALENRPELEINKAQKDINAIDQQLYKDQTKPQIDLVASYSSGGIGGDPNRAFNPSIQTPCIIDPTSPACANQLANLRLLTGNPYSSLFAFRYPIFRLGVNINIPFGGDKAAEAQLGRSRVEAERLEVQREQIEQGIQVEVRNALQALRTAEARLRSAAIARENSAKQYESEQRKLDEGQSDIYKVLERQTALTAARSNELRFRTELNKAIAEYQRATGNTLAANDIEAKLKK